MNNVVLGGERLDVLRDDRRRQGACPDADGPSGVHVAMSNTLNTPVEALELALPAAGRALRAAARLRRRGRAARRRRRRARAARARAVPALRARAAPRRRPARAAGRRRRRARARTLLNGEELPAFVSRDLDPGDVLRIETPGGGGYGARANRPPTWPQGTPASPENTLSGRGARGVPACAGSVPIAPHAAGAALLRAGAQSR